ncbi:HipA domain-containing protein [Helicobacter suis]|uniref:HipA domain-containing protein n=1 Tax=Helicobacter suis TaxID=104628 RepID=UPI001F07F4FE|nr:HipA domain-containing protein [Helicobacter suis]
MHYTLKNKDRLVLEFEVLDEGKDLRFKVLSETLLPYYLRLNGASKKHILRWLYKRKVPDNRCFAYSILNTLEGGLKADTQNPLAYLNTTLALSLKDSFWVVPTNKAHLYTWAKYNLYENPFNSTLQMVAITGARGQTQGQILSPEPTTDGMLKKYWRRSEKGIELVKGVGEGDELRFVVAREALCEYYMPQVARAMGLNCVEYGLEKGIKEWKFGKERFSTCPLFTSQEVGFLAIWECLPYEVLKAKSGFDYQKICQAIEALMGTQAFSDLMLFDAIIGNIDRHLGNFGMLINNETNELLKPAPIFDNGRAFLNFINEGRVDDYFNLACRQPHYFKSSLGYRFDRLVAMHATLRHLKLLDKLKDFTFIPHPTYRPSKSLIKVCSEVICQRAKDAKRVIHEKY